MSPRKGVPRRQSDLVAKLRRDVEAKAARILKREMRRAFADAAARTAAAIGPMVEREVHRALRREREVEPAAVVGAGTLRGGLADQVRHMRASGRHTATEIAEMAGVGVRTVYRILRREGAWKDC